LSLLGANLTFAQAKADCPATKPAADEKYSSGQVWSYKARRGEAASTVTILKVESLPKLGEIIHIRIDDIALKNCSGAPSPDNIAHAPFSRDAMERSVTRLVKVDPDLPDFQEGYKDWRDHCGGAYTITVAEVMDLDEKTFNSQMGCQP
jgi:hypothetical protein